jgi:Cu/Ag efflux protein CusF
MHRRREIRVSELKKMLTTALLFCAATVLFAALVVSCSDPGKGVQRYVLTGKVVEVDKANQAVVVDMDEIKGYMEAMQMPCHVKDAAQLDGLSRGDAIRADLVVHAHGSWIEDVKVLGKAK